MQLPHLIPHRRNRFPAVAFPFSPRRLASALGLIGLGLLPGTLAVAQTTILGSTGNYAVMAGSTVTTASSTTINGNLGTSSLTGTVSYSPAGSNVGPITQQNIDDFTRAFSGLAAMTPTTNLTGSSLGTTPGAITLAPGVYKFNTSAALTGALILDAQFQSNPVWVFQIGTTFNTTDSSSVTFTNPAGNGVGVANYGLFWQVGGAATFGANTTFEGNVLGGSTFTFGASATINHGRALTATGTIGFGATTSIDFIGADSGYSGGLAFVDAGNTITSIPEPTTYALFAGLLTIAAVAFRRRRTARA